MADIDDLYCDGKRSYDKKTAITAMNLRFKQDHQVLRMYECENGNHWHLTKQVRGTIMRRGKLTIYQMKKKGLM